MRARGFLIMLVSAVIMFAANTWAANGRILYRFTGGTDGSGPSTLLMDSAGNLYGAAGGGGNANDCTEQAQNGCGVIFELRQVNGAWQQSVMYAFQGGSDGSVPSGNLVFDAAGNLYGTTALGGGSEACYQGCGTVFELSPNQKGGWTENVLYRFQGNADGASPEGVITDKAGNLYGVAQAGVQYRGVVYELSAPQWTKKVLYTFTEGLQIFPSPGLVFDSGGSLYGTYSENYACFPQCGAVYRLTPKNGTWTETDLIVFPGGGNGGNPTAPVILDARENIFGTTNAGGNNFGVAFELRNESGHYKPVMLHNFCSLNHCADGKSPRSALLMSANGVVYGTAPFGGQAGVSDGIVFKLEITKYGWRQTVLHSFAGGADGEYPGNLISDTQGNLYGVTWSGGDQHGQRGYGTVFEITP